MDSQEDQIPQVLWHYTTMQSLERILSTRQLWMSNIFYMNDSMEHQLLCKLAMDIGGDTIEQPWRSAIQKTEPLPIYAACLSLKADMLSQWRCYADDGAGVAIGFNSDHIQKRIDKLEVSDDPNWRRTKVKKVRYDANGHKEFVGKVVEPMSRKTIPQDPCEYHLELDAIWNLWQEAARCKSHDFESEQEIRIIHTSPFDSSVDCGQEKTISNQIYFRIDAKKQVVPYVPFPIAHSDTETPPILALMFGPKNQQENMIHATKMMMRSYGYSLERCQFLKSSITYR